jgi:hypothetical protein
MTAPINPIPIGQTASYTVAQRYSSYTTLEQFPPMLSALETTVVYIDPNANIFHLSGPLAGWEGARFGKIMQGEQHIPFEQVLIEGAFQQGATIQRTNINQRLINFRIQVYGKNNYLYRMAEQRWWAGQIENQPGWLGVFTRLSGWRWIQVWPYKTVDTAQELDPVAYGNNFAEWDVTWIAPWPYYSKPTLTAQWKALTSGPPNADGYYSGNIVLANRGDAETYVYYLVSGGGLCQVQDNNSSSMVALPQIFTTDGAVLCNTDPSQRTLTAQNDPADNLFYDIARSSGVLNFFLSGIDQSDQPIWERQYTRFVYTVPAMTATHFTVMHTNPNATISAFLPQRYRRAR